MMMTIMIILMSLSGIATLRVDPVHLMRPDSAPAACPPSDQVN